MYTQNLIDYIKKSPTAFHAVDTAKKMLLSSGATELFENEDLNADRWYKVKIGFISYDEKSEKEKIVTQTDIVQATDFKNALETLEKAMHGTLGDYKIISITETALMDVFRHKAEE